MKGEPKDDPIPRNLVGTITCGVLTLVRWEGQNTYWFATGNGNDLRGLCTNECWSQHVEKRTYSVSQDKNSSIYKRL